MSIHSTLRWTVDNEEDFTLVAANLRRTASTPAVRSGNARLC